MADYTQLGYNEFMIKEDTSSLMPGMQGDPYSALSANQFGSPTSGNNIQGGIITDTSGRLILDLSVGVLRINDGAIDRIKLGLLDDGSTGLSIKDINGNLIMQVSGTTNLLQSSNKNMILDFILQQLLISDDSGLPRVEIGNLGG